MRPSWLIESRPDIGSEARKKMCPFSASARIVSRPGTESPAAISTEASVMTANDVAANRSEMSGAKGLHMVWSSRAQRATRSRHSIHPSHAAFSSLFHGSPPRMIWLLRTRPSRRREDDVEIAPCVCVGRIELHGAAQMLDRFVACPLERERRAEVPLSAGRARLEPRRFTKLGDRFVHPPVFRVRDAERVVQIRRLGNDRAEVRAPGNEPRLPIGRLTCARQFGGRRSVGAADERQVRGEPLRFAYELCVDETARTP